MGGIYEEWLAGLAGYGCVFMELVAGTKRTRRFWHKYEAMHATNGGSCLNDAQRWMASGNGPGILLRGPLWALDVDEASWIERVLSDLSDARIVAPFLWTPSGGAHSYFRFPPDFNRVGLKNHVCHPLDADGEKIPMDFKLGPRSLLVGPGAIRIGKRYEPQTPWFDPPELDPRFFLKDGDFWFPPGQPFVVVDGPLEKRIAMACSYLGSPRTPVSICGNGGRKALRTVTAYLVAYLQLDPALAVHLLTHGPSPWNSRCRNLDGSPSPWSISELWRACADAVDAVPQAGVRQYKRNQQREVALPSFMEMLQQSIRAEMKTCTSVQDLQASFETWSGTYTTPTMFGRALRRASIPRKHFTFARLTGVQGVDIALLNSLLLGSAPP